LIPIWLYKGRQGFHNKVFQWACYAFYPVHIMMLILLQYWLLQ
ncbi:MAG: conjugal transfer protein TraX, partial [Lachnospiraceae bacterium]|nr:conjugal transfer protein TraX [Lachnospiraceae bacterium]